MKQESHVSEPCASIQDDLKAYCDGELSWLRRIQIRRHLAACVPCREEAHAMQGLHEELRDAESPDATFAPALRARILAQVATIPPLPEPRRTPPLWKYGLAASLAANCLLLFLWYRTGALPSPQPAPGAARPTGASAPSTPVTPSKSRHAYASVEAARGRDGHSPTVTDTFHPPPPATPSQSHVVSPVAQPRPVPPPAATAKSLAGGVAPDAATTTRVGGQAPLPGVPPDSKTGGVYSFRAAKRLSDSEARPQPAPSLKPDVSAAPVPGGPLEPLASPPPAAGTTDKTAAPPASPPVSAPVDPGAAPPPAALTRGLSGGGFGASLPAPMKVGAERDKPVAVNPWPVLSVSWPRETGARAARTIAARTVTADWQVDEQGRVSDIRFVATGIVTLEAAVRDAIRRNRYLPALKNGRPVAARMSYEFVANP